MTWREAKGYEEINIYQSERRRRTIHSLPKESRVRQSSIGVVCSQNVLFYVSSYPVPLSPSSSGVKVHPTSDGAVDEGRKSQGNHGYQTRAAMEETSRQSAEAADDDDSTSEVHATLRGAHNSFVPFFLCTFFCFIMIIIH